MFEIEVRKIDEIKTQQWHQILMLRSEIFVSEQQCIYTDPDEIDFQAIHFIASENDRLLAYARIYKTDSWHIGRIVTDRNYRKQGHGKELISRCIAYIEKQNQLAEIEMSAQVYLSSYYGNLGFMPVGRMYLEDGIPHILMRYQRHLK